MGAPEEHKEYLKQRDYPLGIEGRHVFDDSEKEMLKRYGYWLEALATGKIQPSTTEQEEFVHAVQSGGEKVLESKMQAAWLKLVARREFEKDSTPHHPKSESEWTPRGQSVHKYGDNFGYER